MLQLTLALCLALAASPALALTCTGDSDSLGPHLFVDLTVSDTLTSETALFVRVDADELTFSEGVSETQGVLSPRWFLSTLDFRWAPLTFSGAVGTASIPWTLSLTVVDVVYHAADTEAFLTPDGMALLPGGAERTTDMYGELGAGGRVLGTLDGFGTPFAFDTGTTLFCNRCVSGVLTATPDSGTVGAFSIASAEGARLYQGDFAADGLTWTLQLTGTMGDTRMTAVPEPGISLLLGSGFLALAIGRFSPRRRSREGVEIAPRGSSVVAQP